MTDEEHREWLKDMIVPAVEGGGVMIQSELADLIKEYIDSPPEKKYEIMTPKQARMVSERINEVLELN